VKFWKLQRLGTCNGIWVISWNLSLSCFFNTRITPQAFINNGARVDLEPIEINPREKFQTFFSRHREDGDFRGTDFRDNAIYKYERDRTRQEEEEEEEEFDPYTYQRDWSDKERKTFFLESVIAKKRYV
jgi:hypothetical protein